MRKLLLIICIVSLGYASQAQTTKGTVAFTGSLGYWQYRSITDHKNDIIPFEGFEMPRNKQSRLTLSPSIGYFIKDNLEVGVSAFSSHSKIDGIYHSFMHDNGIMRLERQYTTLRDTKEKGYNVYARKYIFLTEKLAMYGTLSAGQHKSTINSVYTSTSSDTQSYGETDSELTTFAAALSPGITFFASQKIGLSANLGAIAYNRDKREETSFYKESGQPQPFVHERPSYTFNSLVFSFSTMHLNFGVSYYLGK